MAERVIIEVREAVAHVQLNRPDKRNGLDSAMLDGLVDVGLQIRQDRSIRAVVLSAVGESFCAGLDFAAFLGDGSRVTRMLEERPNGGPANHFQRVAWIWQELEVPVIAALVGHVYGGGLQIALGCDMRYASASAQLSVMEIKWGLIPDMSLTKTLPRLVGLDVAKEMTFSGRVLGGREAREVGLVTRVCEDPVAEALAMAALIASKSPHAIRAAKQLLNVAPELDVASAFALETELQRPLLGSRNQLEAVQANFTKRDPEFEDP